MDKIEEISNFILRKYEKMSGKVLRYEKLYILVYLAQRESLMQTGELLFKDEINYSEIGIYLDIDDDDCIEFARGEKISDESKKIIMSVLEKFAYFEYWYLLKMIKDDFSWRNAKTRDEKGEKKGYIIKWEDMRRDAERIKYKTK